MSDENIPALVARLEARLNDPLACTMFAFDDMREAIAALEAQAKEIERLYAEITRLGLALEDTLPELVNIATSEWVEPLRVSDMEKVKQIIRNVIARVREALRGKP